MRLFIAIDLPEDVKKYLRTLQENLPEAKMAKNKDFHCTLKFLGECKESALGKIEAVLSSIHFESCEITLNNLGTFGGKYPRVVWVGLSVPESFSKTVRDIEKRLASIGFSKENDFVPHVTLARVKHIEDPSKFSNRPSRSEAKQQARSAKQEIFAPANSLTHPKGATTALTEMSVLPMKFSVSHFALYQSTLTTQGAVHTKLNVFRVIC